MVVIITVEIEIMVIDVGHVVVVVVIVIIVVKVIDIVNVVRDVIVVVNRVVQDQHQKIDLQCIKNQRLKKDHHMLRIIIIINPYRESGLDQVHQLLNVILYVLLIAEMVFHLNHRHKQREDILKMVIVVVTVGVQWMIN